MTRDEVRVVLFNLRSEAEAAELAAEQDRWRDAATTALEGDPAKSPRETVRRG